MDALGIERAHVVGNSMGGRIAIEVGLRAPSASASLGLLCPAVAFVKRTYHPVVRLMRPELGLLPHRFAREKVAEHFWALFADPDGIDPSVADVVVDEFQRIYASAGGRIAFLSSARNIYLEAPYGRNGFYGRLSQLEPPALFVWGSHDRVIPPAFGRHVARWLPSAEQIVLDGCGHVPQVERAEQTERAARGRFFGAPTRADRCRSAAREGPRRLEAMDTETASRPSRNGHHADGDPFAGAPGAASRRPTATRRAARRPGAAPQPARAPRRRDRRRRARPGPRRRPRRARPGLHPREPARPVAAGEPLVSRRGARPGQRPRGGRGAAGRQPLRRQHDT